jgi:hypothetical protein
MNTSQKKIPSRSCTTCERELRLSGTYLGVCIDELILYDGSFAVEATPRLQIIVQGAFSIAIFNLQHVSLSWAVTSPYVTLSWRSSKRRGRGVFWINEAIRELAIAAKSIISPHYGGFCWMGSTMIGLLRRRRSDVGGNCRA